MPNNDRVVYESKYKDPIYHALGLSFRNHRTSVTQEEHDKLKENPLYGKEFAKVGELRYKAGSNVPRVKVQRNDQGKTEAVIEMVRAYEHPSTRNKIEGTDGKPMTPEEIEKLERTQQEKERKSVVGTFVPHQESSEDERSEIDKLFE
jgi:hypothetical protein